MKSLWFSNHHFSQSFTKTYTYDSYGRVEYENWHTGFGIRNVYNSYGYLSEVETQDNISVWSNATYNARGQITDYDLGDDYEATRVWDGFGFPRKIMKQSPNEASSNSAKTSDSLGMCAGPKDWRAERASAVGASIFLDFFVLFYQEKRTKKEYRNTTYYDNGNIDNRSDIGDYAYTQQDAGPHAFTGLSNTTGNLLPPTSQTVDYTAFNKASHISQDSLDYFITYGPDRLRRIKCYTRFEVSLLSSHYR